MRVVRFVLAAVMIAAVGAPFGAALASEALPALPANLSAPPQATPMPAFSFTDLRGGALQSSDMQGKVVVIRFWATW